MSEGKGEWSVPVSEVGNREEGNGGHVQEDGLPYSGRGVGGMVEGR